MVFGWIERPRLADYNSDGERIESSSGVPNEVINKQSKKGSADDADKTVNEEEKDPPDDRIRLNPRKPGRLRKVTQDYDQSSEASQPAQGQQAVAVSECPIISALLRTEEATSCATRTEAEESTASSCSPCSSSADDKGLRAIMDCLEISKRMTQHLVNTFCGGSEASEEEIRNKIANGRTSITRYR